MTEKPDTTAQAVRPTALDRAIMWVAPAWGVRRQRARYEASYRGGVSTRLSESFTRAQGLRFGTSLERWELMNARDRGYQAYRNNPVARTLVDTETDNVIGDGLNLQADTSSADFNREVEDRYYAWVESADLRHMHSGVELQRMLWSRSRVAGDIGWILVARGPDSYLQVVPGENICTPDTRLNAPNLVSGIQFDDAGAPRLFYVLDWDERGKRNFTPIGYRDFVFLPHLSEPNQPRGETCYLTVFDLLAHLDRYVDGVSLAAWMATVFGILFKQAGGAKEVASLGTLTNSQGTPQKAITLENGMVKFIGTQDEVAQVQAHQPMQQTPEFIRAMLRQIGMPFGMPLEVIAKDMSTVNFASARIGLLNFYRACRVRQERFISRWSRTYRWWVAREVNRAPDDPKRFKSKVPSDYWHHEFLANAWDYTDPVSEAQADLLQIDMGTKTPQQVIAERGRNAAQILEQRRAWMRETADLPRVASTMTRHPQLGVGAVADPLGQERIEPDGNPAPDGGGDGGTTNE